MIKKYLPKIISGVVLCCLPFVFGDQYISHIFSVVYLYVIMAIGLSIVVSYAGLLDLGYVAFFAVGAYLYALLNTHYSLPFLIAIPLGALCAALFGFILGFPTLRVRGDYLALVTLAFGEMIRTVLTNWTSLTNGPKGIYAIESPHFFGIELTTPGQYYYLVLACLAIAILLHYRLSSSPIALIWESLRDDEIAARASGVNPQKYYLIAFAIGASFAGVVGVLFASIQKFVSPESFVLDESILVLSIVVLSGGKSVLRIFIAATVFYLVPELLRGFKEYRLLVFGAFLVLFPVYENRFREIAITLRGYVARLLPKHLLESKKDSYDNFKPDYSPILIRKENVSLKLCGVTKNFAGLRALDNISFERHLSKTITALIGPNGAGKTTLFNCLSGIERTTEGTISFGTINDINYVPAYELAVSGIGRTFQNVRLFKTMSVYQNVMVGCFCGKTIPFWQSLIGTKKYKDFMTACSSKADYYIELLGLVPLRHANVCGLPFGLQRKVEIARALAVEPSFLLLDEVASGLNDGEKKELANTLRNLTQTLGISIFLVEHDMPFVMDLAEHIIVLDSGKIIAEGTPHLISKDQQVIEAYLGNPYAVG